MRRVIGFFNHPMVLVIMIVVDVFLVVSLAHDLHQLSGRLPVKPPYSLPTPIITEGELFEFCVIHEGSRESDKAIAGTPVAGIPVIIEPTPVATSSTYSGDTMVEATIAPSNENDMPLLASKITVVNSGRFSENNWHFVFIGVGYGEGENGDALQKLIDETERHIRGVRVDFAYVEEPIDLDINHIDTQAQLASAFEASTLVGKIRMSYPVDSLAVSVKTKDLIGTSDLQKRYIVLTGNIPASAFVATHEMGHQLGIADGYNAYFPPRALPNSELFYIDEMPRNLARALKKLNQQPPMYLAGTCNGRMVYTFYETANNIYGNYSPSVPNSWGDSPFTPLQIQIMNDYIQSAKGGK